MIFKLQSAGKPIQEQMLTGLQKLSGISMFGCVKKVGKSNRKSKEETNQREHLIPIEDWPAYYIFCL